MKHKSKGQYFEQLIRSIFLQNRPVYEESEIQVGWELLKKRLDEKDSTTKNDN